MFSAPPSSADVSEIETAKEVIRTLVYRELALWNANVCA